MKVRSDHCTSAPVVRSLGNGSHHTHGGEIGAESDQTRDRPIE